MKKPSLLLLTFLLASNSHLFADAKPLSAHADLINAQGEKTGTVALTEGTGGVQVSASVEKLPPGFHAFHVHAVGKCDGPDFKSAGGHFNPLHKQHGLKNPQGSHVGDMADIEVGADGKGSAKTVAHGATLSGGESSLFHPDGTTLVIHASQDDGMTDPAGNAGARIACGVIVKD